MELEIKNRIIDLQQEIITQQNDTLNNFKFKQAKILEDFNNRPTGQQLYEQNLNEKVDLHKYRVKQYNQFIYKHGMKTFTDVFIKSHHNSTYLQNFHEFIDYCPEDMKESIRLEFAKREFEMMKSIYMDFMPLLEPEKVVSHMMYLDEDFGEVLDELDILTKR